MANEKKTNKNDNEAARRKKEEQARRARRRSRQWIGFALSILIVIGVVSIVRSAINVAQQLTDNTAEKEAYEDRLLPMVWFDVLPFSSVDQLDENAIKQVAIWGYMIEAGAGIERTETELAIVPVLEVDRYAAEMFGPDFQFTEHAAFRDVTLGLEYQFDADRNAYIVPGTGLEQPYDPLVVQITNERNGIKRVTVGYVPLRNPDGVVVTNRDQEPPSRYMDFIFQRDGNDYYLISLERNTTYVPPATSSASSVAPAQSAYVPPEDLDADSFEEVPASVSVPEPGSEGAEDGTDEGASDGDSGSSVDSDTSESGQAA